MRKSKLKKNLYVGLGLVIGGFAIFRIGQASPIVGYDFTVIARAWFSLLASLMVFVFALWALMNEPKARGSNGFLKFPLMGFFVGFGNGMLFYVMEANGWYIDEVTTASFTITDFQIVLLVLWVIISFIVGGARD